MTDEWIMNYGKKIALYRSPSQSESALSFDDLEDDEKDTVKRKSRNLSEKKRRDQFNVLINELCSMVASSSKKIDKSSVLKSAIQFLRNHQEFSVQSAANEIKEDWKPTFLCNEEFAQLMLEAVDSFLVVFSQQGKVLFTSESVTSLLGHLPTDLINNSLYDLMHEDDRLKFFDLLSKQTQDSSSISFTCHLRRGTIDPNESASYEYVHVFGTPQLIASGEDSPDLMGMSLGGQASLCFCCTVKLVTSHIIREMSVVDEATSEFTSRHSLEWKFLFLDHRAPPIIGYLPFEVLGTSGYDYYHPDDLDAVSKCHEELMVKGKGTSSFYRFLTKGQQWIWLQTRFFITYHQWNSKPEFIVCTNTIVNYCDVRRQLRQEMGYQDGDSPLASGQGSNQSSGSSIGGGGGSSKLAAQVKDATQSEDCHVTSLGQPETPGLGAIVKVQSPDVASSQHTEGDRMELPHSTKQEGGNAAGGGGGGNSSKRFVSSQLQSLLQMHLQRSLMSSASSSSTTTATATGPHHPHSHHQQHQSSTVSSPAVSAASSSASGKLSVSGNSAGTGPAVGPRNSRKGSLVDAQQQLTVSSSISSSLPSLAAQVSPSSSGRDSSSLVPIMAAPTINQLATSGSPVLPAHSGEMVTSAQASRQLPTTSQFQSGLVLTATQQLLRDQLIQKSRKLQDDIQKQQEELRMINSQLSYAHTTTTFLHPPPQPQPRQIQQQQQQQLQQQQSSSSKHFQHPAAPPPQPQPKPAPQQQPPPPPPPPPHQYIIQPRLGLPAESMVFAPGVGGHHQLAMMGSNPGQIFLSPVANMSMEMGPAQSPPTAATPSHLLHHPALQQQPDPQQQQQHSTATASILHHHGHQTHYQPQQIVLHQDASGLGGQHMVLTPTTSAHQLAMMASTTNQIFFSPINMDLQPQQQQPQQQPSPLEQQQHAIHYSSVAIPSSDLTSPSVDLPDSC